MIPLVSLFVALIPILCIKSFGGIVFWTAADLMVIYCFFNPYFWRRMLKQKADNVFFPFDLLWSLLLVSIISKLDPWFCGDYKLILSLYTGTEDLFSLWCCFQNEYFVYYKVPIYSIVLVLKCLNGQVFSSFIVEYHFLTFWINCIGWYRTFAFASFRLYLHQNLVAIIFRIRTSASVMLRDSVDTSI
jgi:hypothetical protein